MRNEAQAHAQREAMQDAFSSLSGFEKPSMRAAQIVLSKKTNSLLNESKVSRHNNYTG